MNILHWPTSYPDPSRNQPYHAIFVKEHIQSVAPYSNNKVLYISPEDTMSNKWHEITENLEGGIEVTRFYFNQKLNPTFLNFYIRIVLLFYFVKLILVKRFYPNIIHVHFFQSFFWAKHFSLLFNIPIVLTEHWSAFIGWPDIGKSRYEKSREAFKFAKKIMPVSLKLLNGINNSIQLNISDKSQIINNAVDSDLFSYEINQTNNDLINRIIFIGRNAEEKDIPTLFEAIAKLKEAELKFILEMIGTGNYYNLNKLKENHELGDYIIEHGQLDKKSIKKILESGDLLVISSTMENSPCVIGEAHCCGVPVVATDVGGVNELIIEGFVVPPKSPELLAEKILEQLAKTIDREALALKAKERFGYEAIGKQILEVYKEVCAE